MIETKSRRCLRWVNELLGQTNLALDDFRAALDSRPDLRIAKEGLARIMAQQKQTDDKSGEPLKNP
jgi:hypothetical protein